MPIIVKSNDDLRQEQFVSQLLFQFDSIFKAARLPVWLRPYDILAITDTGGLIEVCSGAGAWGPSFPPLLTLIAPVERV
jgi:phosphatidylinositol kinase/protein kinase (PI-3  family)